MWTTKTIRIPWFTRASKRRDPIVYYLNGKCSLAWRTLCDEYERYCAETDYIRKARYIFWDIVQKAIPHPLTRLNTHIESWGYNCSTLHGGILIVEMENDEVRPVSFTEAIRLAESNNHVYDIGPSQKTLRLTM